MAQTNYTPIIVTVLVVIGVLAAVWLLVGKIPSTGENTISATGNAEMSVMPDEAVVYLLVETRAISAEKAKDDNARISDDVLTALIKIGIDRKDIETQNFNIYPEYDWTDGKQTLKGYVASNSMKVTSKDFNNVGKIVDAAVDKGALVNSIDFELSNDKSNEYKTQILAKASQDAKTKAGAIAAGLGKKLGKLVSVSSSDYNYAPYPMFARSDMAGTAEAKVAATNLQPQNLDITATVSVSYAIG